MIAPCGHLYCPDCLEHMGDYCERCRAHFDWNQLQRLQPGFEASDFVFALDATSSSAPAPAPPPHEKVGLTSSKSLHLLNKVGGGGCCC